MDIQAPSVITNEGLIHTLENMWKVFEKNEPEYCKQFLEWVNKRRGSLINSSGMSEDGHFMAYAEIPPKIYHMMIMIYGQNWMDNPKIATPFYRVFENFRINKTRSPNFNTNRDFERKENPWIQTDSELVAS